MLASFLYDVRAPMSAASWANIHAAGGIPHGDSLVTQATLCPRGDRSGGFVNGIPMKLYSPISSSASVTTGWANGKAAAHYNRLAGEIRLQKSGALHNQQYFASIDRRHKPFERQGKIGI